MTTEAIVSIIDHSGRQLKWLARACHKISMVADLSKMSSIYIDEFEDDKDDSKIDKSLVIAILLKSSLKSDELFKNLVRIETEIRTEATQDVMDVLILAFGDELKMAPDLTLPHPKFHQHPQFLYPAAEIVGNFMHPVLNRTLRDLAGSMGIKWGRYFEQGSRLLDFS